MYRARLKGSVGSKGAESPPTASGRIIYSMATKPAGAAGTVTLFEGRTVNRMGFGSMRLTGPGIWGEPKDPDECRAVLRRAVELGVNFIDTADSYGPGVAERLIAEALYPYPKDLVIATKGGLVRPGPDMWPADGRPEHLRAACEGSLRRLRLQTIDLYQLHRPDPKVPFEESLGTIINLRNEGKVRAIGLSNVTVKQLEVALGMTEIVSVQNRYNLGDRRSEEVLDRCTKLGIAFLPWAPVSAGQVDEESPQIRELARRKGVTPYQLAIAWLVHRSPVVLPIPGTSKVKHLEENIAAAAIKLDPGEASTIAA